MFVMSLIELIIVAGVVVCLLAVFTSALRNANVIAIGIIGFFVLLGIALPAAFFLSVQRTPVENRQIATVKEAASAEERTPTLAELNDAEIAESAEMHKEDNGAAEAEQQEIEAKLAAERPRWVQEGARVLNREDVSEAQAGAITVPDIFIVQSGLWSTKAEAVSEAESLAERLIGDKAREVFASHYDDSSIRQGMQMYDQLMLRTFTETRPVQLTSDVETEMTRAYVEVITTPEELQAFTPVVRHYAAQERLKISGAALAAVITLAVLMSLIIDWRGRSGSKHFAE